jgi:hypothetical protein
MWIIAGNANVTATRFSIEFQVTFIGVLQSIQKYSLLSEHCRDWIRQRCCRGAYATPLYAHVTTQLCVYIRIGELQPHTRRGK